MIMNNIPRYSTPLKEGIFHLDVIDFVETSNTVVSPDEAFDLFVGAVGEYGYDQVAFGALSPAAQNRFGRERPAPAVVLNYPEDWINYYFENEYQSIDPVVLQTPSRRRAFLWKSLEERTNLTRDQVALFREGEAAGLRDGLSVPIHGPFGELFVVSLASAAGGTDGDRLLSHLQMLSIQFQVAYTSLATGEPPPPARLTQRERECLLWSARGKSTWSIGKILSISEHTVQFHLKQAMTKLGTTNRVVAIVTALRAGLIDP